MCVFKDDFLVIIFEISKFFNFDFVLVRGGEMKGGFDDDRGFDSNGKQE